MITANRNDPRGSGLYLTFDSPNDFLATLEGRENPCTAIFHPRDFPTNAVDPSGLDAWVLGTDLVQMWSWQSVGTMVTRWMPINNARQLMNNLPMQVHTLILEGHAGSATEMTFGSLSRGQLVMLPNGEFAIMQGNDTWSFDLLMKRGLKRIELRGCNIAGPCAHGPREEAQKKACRDLGYNEHPEWFTGETDDNLPNKLAQKYRGLEVLGSKGLWFPGYDFEGDTTKSRTPGYSSLSNPLNYLKRYKY